ncbi:hypothetical protein PPACK8108_LOCUS17148 [Phakopsora pachyrhizi]|uniref:Uncharacterized protein n=1 Tax=Phakopsora pachyrhizi TaxID=170000 RepID=A0AAV0BCH0_PHAPC|nr:hypothetical protein PPACK8108_LOCUS17148 [Phakopsora pachyrhizi]
MLVGMSEAGLKYTEISQKTGISKSTIKDIVHRCGTVETAPTSERPRKLVDRDLQGLHRLVSTNRRARLSDLADSLPKVVSERTV